MSIDKTEAAERLIVSAIQMVEREDDRLATHLVAASALRILRDLMGKDEKEYAAELLKNGMFTLAEMKLSGDVPDLPVPPDVADQVNELAEAIKSGEVTSANDLKPTHEKPWELLKYIDDPTNFLKHADRDPLSILSEDEFCPEDAISNALTAYSFVCPGKPLPDEIRPYLKRNDFLQDC